MTNNDEEDIAPLFSVEKLARIMVEALKSKDPDVRAALENLDEVLQRSKVRELRANINKVRAPRSR